MVRKNSSAAIAFAARLADRYEEPLTVIFAWGNPEPWGMVEPMLIDVEPTEEDNLLIAESIAGLASQYPDLVVNTEISGSRPEAALCTAAAGARMLVVGSRGRQGFTRALLGSVSEAVVAELPCPVAVIRDDAEPRANLP